MEERWSTYLGDNWHSRSVGICGIGTGKISAGVRIFGGNSLLVHIVDYRAPVFQVFRDLVDHLLSMGCVRALVRVVADQLALTKRKT